MEVEGGRIPPDIFNEITIAFQRQLNSIGYFK